MAPWLNLLLLLCMLPLPAAAKVVSETIFFLQEDGRSLLLQRGMRTDSRSHRFLLDKRITLDDIRHIAPPDFSWDDSSRDDVNLISFDSGSFTLIYPDRLGTPHLTVSDSGEYTYRSWDGTTDPNGHQGIWYAPGDFDEFTYSWVFPDGFEVLGYESNQSGKWIRRGNAVSFHASDVNDLKFTIRYRPKGRVGPLPKPADTNKDEPTKPPMAAKSAQKPEAPPLVDLDLDGVPDLDDRCPDTPANALVTLDGCALDCDGDGVVRERDACPGTAQGARVDERGCEIVRSAQADSDKDAIADASDLCPQTPQGAKVDRVGCPLDADRDGVADGIDRCPASHPERPVDDRGCRIREEA